MNSLLNYLNSFMSYASTNFFDNPEWPLSRLVNSFNIPKEPMTCLPFHIVLFSSFMFLASMYGYSVLHNVNILCIGQVYVWLFFASISLLASMAVTTISAIWSFRINSKKCLRAFFLIVSIFSIVAFVLLMVTVLTYNDSGMMVKNDNGVIYKCKMTTLHELGSSNYNISIEAYQVLFDYNATKVIGANNTCVFQQMDDTCCTYGSFRQSTELRDKKEALGAYICSNSDEIGVSLCRLHLSTLSIYMSLITGIGFLLNSSLVISNLYFFKISCRNTNFSE